eukprot:XP_001700763.1 predicted protein [Chlamydomonas reinhardtii]
MLARRLPLVSPLAAAAAAVAAAAAAAGGGTGGLDGSGWGWGCCLGCGLAPQYAGAAAAELRGRSSQAVDKKSFALELQGPDGKQSQEVSLLGMPAASDWVLSSLALDRSLVRDALAFTLARAQGGNWEVVRGSRVAVHER